MGYLTFGLQNLKYSLHRTSSPPSTCCCGHPGIEILPVEHLSDLVGHLTGLQEIPPCIVILSAAFDKDLPYTTDFADIIGQEHVKRAMEIAAAGGHNALVSWTTTRGILSVDYSGLGRKGIESGHDPGGCCA